MHKINHTIILASLLFISHPALGQEKTVKPTKQQRTETRAGNKAYKHKAYTDAEAAYKKATDTVVPYYKAEYNMGNALYRQKQYDRAAQHYAQALKDPRMNNKQKSQTFHNLGNACLQQGLSMRDGQGGGRELFQQAVQNYQEALKLDPKNQDTKYNLSYAKKMLAQAQSQSGGGGGSGQSENNDKQQQDKGDQPQQNQPQNNQQQHPKEQQGQRQSQPQKNQKEQDDERLLNAVRNNERNTLREHQKRQESKVDARIEKDW